MSGAKADRIGLAALMNVLRAGDAVVIWRLDRLGRSVKNLIQLVERLETVKVGLHVAASPTAEGIHVHFIGIT